MKTAAAILLILFFSISHSFVRKPALTLFQRDDTHLQTAIFLHESQCPALFSQVNKNQVFTDPFLSPNFGNSRPLTHSAAGCKTKTKLPCNVQREFMLITLHGFTRDQLVEARAEIDLSNLPDAGIYIGCDTAYRTVKLMPPHHISFGKYTQTSKNCPHGSVNQQMKKALDKILPTINYYKIEGHFMLLYSGKKLKIKAIAKDWD